MLRRYIVTISGVEHRVALEPLPDGRWRVSVDDRETTLAASADGGLVLNEMGRVFRVDTAPAGRDVLVRVRGADAIVQVQSESRHLLRSRGQAAPGDGAEDVCAPMPGRIVKVAVTPGDAIGTGQPLVVVEAMKMENELRSTRSGTVTEVWVKEGQTVEAGERLVSLDGA